MHADKNRKIKVVVLGGGTGTSGTLRAIKKYSDFLDITAIVTTADEGGKNAILEADIGLIKISDMRQAMVALADDKEISTAVLAQALSHKFVNDKVQGYNAGNLLLIALTDALADVYGGNKPENQLKANQIMEWFLHSHGRVLPVSLVSPRLVVHYADGTTIVGESLLDDFPGDGTQKVIGVEISPYAPALPQALEAIRNADVIIQSAGDLVASQGVNYCYAGVIEAVLSNRKAIFVQIMNLVTKFGQSHKLPASGHIDFIEGFIGKGRINHVIINNEHLPEEALAMYAAEKDYPVFNDLPENDARVILAPVAYNACVAPKPGDPIKRSLVRHHPEYLGQVLADKIFGIL